MTWSRSQGLDWTVQVIERNHLFHFKSQANQQQNKIQPKKSMKNQRFSSKGMAFQESKPMTHDEEEERLPMTKSGSV